MIIEILDDNSIVKWKMNDKEDWKSAEVSDLIMAYEERPQGEWEEGNHGDYERPDFYFQCSVCKEETDDETPYCPYCGADMRGKEE